MVATSITMIIVEELKIQLQELVSNFGMDMTTFYNISRTGSERTENPI